jgi:hypothetical protein
MFEFSRDFFGRLLERAVEAVGRLGRGHSRLSARFQWSGEWRISLARRTMRMSLSLTGGLALEGPSNLGC